MRYKKIMILTIILTCLFAVSAVNAVDDNATDELSEDLVIDDAIAENLNDDNLTSDDEGYVDATDAYEYLNQYRSENGAWYWNGDDTTVTYFNTYEYNQLQPLKRDASLEEVAIIRAKELSVLFDHKRPDDTDCFSIYPSGFFSLGENIAISDSAKVATDAWKEDFLESFYQGHRRNMLNPYFDSVGIAAYKKGGETYWIQAFGLSEPLTTDYNISVDSLKGSLGDLYDLIGNNSEIKLDKDYAYNNDSNFRNGIVIENDLTIDGCGHSIDGKKFARIFNITADKVIFNNITFLNGNEDYGYGGAIYSTCKNLTFINCIFIKNNGYYGSGLYSANSNVYLSGCSFADNYGVEGMVYSYNSNISVENCNFKNNSAILYGGAIASNYGIATITNCNFTENKGYKGGVLSFSNGQGTVSDCSFSENSAGNCGGAIYSNGAKVSVSNITFDNNSAVLFGGAVSSDKSDFTILNCSFTNNNVRCEYFRGFGGAMYAADGFCSVEDCEFTNNYIDAARSVTGGAISLSNNNASITDCEFSGNYIKTTYYADGGALSLIKSVVSISDCKFIENFADVNSGAIYSYMGNLSARNCSFINHRLNSSFDTHGGLSLSSCGGVIYSDYADFSFIDCDFINSTAYYGGTIYLDHGNGLIENCDFVNSEAFSGGAIYSSYSRMMIINSSLINIVGKNFGAGISSRDGNLSVFDSNFTNNVINHTFDAYGAAIFFTGGNFSVGDSIFTNNYAVGGGVLYLDSADTNITGCKFTNNSADFAGVLYAKRGSVSIENSNFTDNHAQYAAGALFLTNVNGDIVDCSFTDNSAGDYDYGGAIYAPDSKVRLNDSIFTNNTAFNGGAVYGCDATGCTFTLNFANGYAAAIYGINNIAYNCRFIKNTAFRESPTYNVTTIDCIFEENRIITRAEFDTQYLESSYYQGDIVYINLRTEDYEYVFNVTVTARAYKNSVLVNTINFVNGDGWDLNITEGDYVFEFSVENQDYIVSPVNVTLTVIKNEIADVNINVGNHIYLENTLADITSNVDGYIRIYIDDVYCDYINVAANTTLKLEYVNVPAGTHTMTATIYPTNPRVHQKTFTKEFYVLKKQTSLTLDVKNATSDENVVVNVTASEYGNVEVMLDGIVRSVEVAANLKTQIDFGVLNKGMYTVSATFSAGDNYIASNASETFNVFGKISLDDIKIDVPQGNSNDMTFSLPADATGKVTLSIAGENYEFDVINGVANIVLPNLTGENPYVITYSGDANYAGFSVSGSFDTDSSNKNITIKPDMEITSFEEGLCQVKLPGDATGTVTLVVNGTDYSFPVVNGVANVFMPDLANGNYNYTITYSGDGKYSSFTKSASMIVNNIVPTNIVASSKVNTVYGGKYTVATLKDSNGNPLKDVKVTVKFSNGKIYTSTTDKNGRVIITVGVVPKTYKATITFAGNANYAKSTKTINIVVKKATPKITAKAKTFKKSVKTKKYTIILKNNMNKVMKNIKITIKVNKKTYTAKTNSKGQATFKITKLTKKGTFKSVITYSGSSYYNKVTKTVNIKCR